MSFSINYISCFFTSLLQEKKSSVLTQLHKGERDKKKRKIKWWFKSLLSQREFASFQYFTVLTMKVSICLPLCLKPVQFPFRCSCFKCLLFLYRFEQLQNIVEDKGGDERNILTNLKALSQLVTKQKVSCLVKAALEQRIDRV